MVVCPVPLIGTFKILLVRRVSWKICKDPGNDIYFSSNISFNSSSPEESECGKPPP